MDGQTEIERIEHERSELLEEAGRIVQAAGKEGRIVGGEEDAKVLALMVQVRSLEEQLGHLRRRRREDNRTWNRI